MKLFLVSCLVALAAADVSHIVKNEGPNAQIVKQEFDASPDGSYQWAYEADNGISANEQGRLKGTGEDAGTDAQGAFRWIAPDGKEIAIQYIANENGYQPQGAAIPTPHPIPEAIVRSLEYNSAHPQKK